MNARHHLSILLSTLILGAAAQAGAEGAAEKPAADPAAEQNRFANIKFEPGPLDGKLEDIATVKVPEGMLFVSGRSEAKKFITASENLVSNQEVGILINTADDEQWWMSFEFDPIGYVKDADKEELDADALLESMKKGTEQGNAERKRQGWGELHLIGWQTPPRYNPTTHNLEWGTRLKGDGAENVNYNVRLLGRRGVMSVTLVTGSNVDVTKVLPKVQGIISGFSFTPEQAYSAFKPGDKIAEYGLTALVAGGVIAVAAKSGILGKIWKFLVLGVAALAGGVKKLFSRKKPDQPTV